VRPCPPYTAAREAQITGTLGFPRLRRCGRPSNHQPARGGWQCHRSEAPLPTPLPISADTVFPSLTSQAAGLRQTLLSSAPTTTPPLPQHPPRLTPLSLSALVEVAAGPSLSRYHYLSVGESRAPSARLLRRSHHRPSTTGAAPCDIARGRSLRPRALGLASPALPDVLPACFPLAPPSPCHLPGARSRRRRRSLTPPPPSLPHSLGDGPSQWPTPPPTPRPRRLDARVVPRLQSTPRASCASSPFSQAAQVHLSPSSCTGGGGEYAAGDLSRRP